MPSSSVQLVLFGFLVFVATLAVRRTRARLPDWAWIPLNVAPPLITWLCCSLGARVVHDLIKVRLNGETLALVYAGAHFLAILPAIFWGRVGAIVAGLWLCVIGVLLLGDVWYYRFFGALPSILALGSGGQLWEVRDSAVEVVTRQDWVLVTPIFVGGVLAWAWPARKVVPTFQNAVASVVLVSAFWLASTPAVDNVTKWMKTRESWRVFSAGALVRSQGLWGAHLRETARAGRELWLAEELTSARIEEIFRYHRSTGHRRSSNFGEAAGANLLMVQIEALQQWVVTAKVEGELVMPFLSSLLARSVYYSNVWDLTGESPTSDCEYMVLNSQHPLQRGSVAFRRAGNDFVTVATDLAQAGYMTFSAHGFNQTMWNRSVLHPRYGFQLSAFREELGSRPKMGWGLEDVSFFERATAKLSDLRSPWFGFLITLTSHHPYTYIPKERQQLNMKGMDSSLTGYVHSMRYVDDALKGLFEQLSSNGHLSNTLVVMYGDHDSKLYFNEASRRAASRQLGLAPDVAKSLSQRKFETKKIPLVIVPPNLNTPREVTAIGGQIDIGPTVLDWLGRDKPGSFIGEVLTDEADHHGTKPCTACGEAARADGTAVSRELLWDARKSTCYDRRKGTKTAKRLCGPLRKHADQELTASWDVTMHDLAKQLRDAPAR